MDLKARVDINLLGWVRRALASPNSSAAESFRSICGEDSIQVVLGSKADSPKDAMDRSPFYLEVLRWAKVHNEESVRAEILWNNQFISSPKHPLLAGECRTCSRAAIIRIQDIYATLQRPGY